MSPRSKPRSTTANLAILILAGGMFTTFVSYALIAWLGLRAEESAVVAAGHISVVAVVAVPAVFGMASIVAAIFGARHVGSNRAPTSAELDAKIAELESARTAPSVDSDFTV